MPALPYAQDALEGFLSANTLSFHYGKHLKNYVDTTNKLIAGTADESKSLTDIIKTAKGPLFNNAAQVFNHQFYFESISPKSTSVPPEVLAIGCRSRQLRIRLDLAREEGRHALHRQHLERRLPDY